MIVPPERQIVADRPKGGRVTGGDADISYELTRTTTFPSVAFDSSCVCAR